MQKSLLVSALVMLTTSSTQAQQNPQDAATPTVTPKVTPTVTPRILRFANRDWQVRETRGEVSGPGPNFFDARNVWVDKRGALHLKIARRGGVWSCAEISSRERLSFGRYEFEIEGRIDRLDPNVVCGLFLYPTPDVGPNASHEIDIEWARWGNEKYPIGNYTVWPRREGEKPVSHTFPVALQNKSSTHIWDWRPRSVEFQSFNGARKNGPVAFQSWNFRPETAQSSIAQHPMPLHFNLWLFEGHSPTDRREIEIVIRDFRFHAL